MHHLRYHYHIVVDGFSVIHLQFCPLILTVTARPGCLQHMQTAVLNIFDGFDLAQQQA